MGIETLKKEVKWFYIIVTIVSVIIEGFIIAQGALGIAVFLMWVPAVVGFILCGVYEKGKKHRLGFRLCKFKYIVQSIVIPLVYIGVPYVVLWIIKPEALDLTLINQSGMVRFTMLFVIGLPISLLSAIGEEIGWRGFALPRLTKVVGWKKTLFFTSIFWALWHTPILISGLYMPGTPLVYQLPMFVIIICGVGTIIGILTLKSNSVWPAALLHAAHNHFDQTIFSSLTSYDKKMYFVSETGILTAIIIMIIAVWMFRSYAKEQSFANNEVGR